MYKVLIAEDEILVRLGLVNSIPWKTLEMTLTEQASNGVQAWELFQKERPQVVITDIRMPLMDGMELIRKIREIDSECKIIILTCIDEFAYARQAITYQVTDYVLKLSMNMEEIESILKKAKKSLDMSHTTQKSVSPSRISMDADVKQEIYDCLCGHCPTFPYHSRTAPFFSKSFQIAFLRILMGKKGRTEGCGRQQVCTDKSLYQLLQRQLEHNGAILIEKLPGEYFLLLQNQDSFYKDFENVITLVKNYYNSRPICGISGTVHAPEDAAKAGQAAQASLSQYFFHPEQYLFDAGTQENAKYLKNDIQKHIEKIVLDSSDSYPSTAEFWTEYSDRIEQFLSDCPEDSNNIKKLFYYLADWLQEKLSLANSEAADNCVYNYRRYIFEASDIMDIYFIFERLLNKLLSFSISDHSLSREMAEVVRYIEKHYAENLSLEDLSAHINYSKGYICSIFKKELNTTFGNYLAKIRVFHAKKLLASSFLRLYEVAEQTGFYDYSHFSRTFKKVTGFSPQEYQNHQITDIEKPEGNIK